MRNLAVACFGIGLALFAVESVAQDARHGADEYKLCAGCHGFDGAGSQVVNAPALAGQETWYLTRQIMNFRAGIRGVAANDNHGMTMAMMTKGLTSDEKVADIVAYIETLPAAKPVATIEGDLESGRTQYAPCAACHGMNAEGNPVLNAPALSRVDDWYQLRQLQLFKDGSRGAHPDDTYGQQMAAMAGVLANEQAMRDVVAYISSLE